MTAGPRRASRRREPKPPPDAESARELAAQYLAARPRSRWEVARRLRRAGAAEELITGTLLRLEQLGFVDDLAFARWWAGQRDQHAPRGRRLIEAELRRRGVAREVLEALRTEREETPGAPAEGDTAWTDEERAREALARRLRGAPVPDDPREIQRLAAFLARRGFEPDIVWAVLKSERS
jgi:regulatory protein